MVCKCARGIFGARCQHFLFCEPKEEIPILILQEKRLFVSKTGIFSHTDKILYIIKGTQFHSLSVLQVWLKKLAFFGKL